MAINDDIMKQVSSFTNDAQLNDFFRNTGYSAEQLAAASGYSLSDIQSRMDAVRGGSGGNPYDTGHVNNDYTQQIQADLAKLNGGTEADLNAYLATTNYTPEQLAQVSGYNASDIAARMNQAQGSGQQGVRSYLQANPQVAKDYYGFGYSDKGYTLDEYAMQDWQKNGSKPGFGFSANEQGFLQSSAPTNQVFTSKFTPEQQQSIAKTYIDEIYLKPDGSYSGIRNVLSGMEQYGVSSQELAAAVAKYGGQYVPEHYMSAGSASLERALSPSQVTDRVANAAKETGRGEGFGGESARYMPAIREATPEERNAVEFLRSLSSVGKYGGQSPTNVPGAILADVAVSRSTPYITQEELSRAEQIVRGNEPLIYRRSDGSYADARENQNWRQDLQQSVSAEKNRVAGQIRSNEGKVSPFVAGPQTGKNAPGKSVDELAPGLMVNGIRPNSTTTTRTTSTPTTPTTTTKPNAPAPAPAKPFDGTVPTERLAEARRYGLDLNTLTQQELATFVNSGWAGLSQSRQAEWNKQAASRPANPNLMN